MKIPEITPSLLDGAMTYSQYYTLVENLLADGKTTGPDQSEWLVAYAKLNLQRMKRIQKTVQIRPEVKDALNQAQRPLVWLCITEGWCGDAAQICGVLNAMAETRANTKFLVVLRDEHTALIDRFLTNGGRAIPIIILLDAETHDVLGHWGPRPDSLQTLVNECKTTLPKEEMIEKVHVWYTHDKTQTTQTDFLAVYEQAIAH
ncbi:MAG: thioredoxin family protein [Bacteroidia bacterium]